VCLAQATLAQIAMFNRRRSGEVSKMKVSTYQEAMSKSKPTDSDLHAHRCEVERTLCKVLTRIEIPGKRGNIVPILLTQKFKHAVDVLLEKRRNVGIHANKCSGVWSWSTRNSEVDAASKTCGYNKLGH